MDTNDNRNDINLCEILKDHIGEMYYLPLLGYLILEKIDVHKELIFFGYKSGTVIPIKSNGLDNDGQPAVFPTETNRDWIQYDILFNKSTPKTWTQFIEQNTVIHDPYDVCIDITGSKGTGWTRRDTLIENQCLALIKIKTLIDISYGGHVKKEEWLDRTITKHIIKPATLGDDKFRIITIDSFQDYSNIAFRNIDDAYDFLSYPENIKLLETYFDYE